MGTGVLQFPIAPPNRCSHEFSNRRNSLTNIASTSISRCCCFSTKNRGRTGGSEWDRNSRSSRERTKYLGEFFSYDYEDDGQDYDFRNTGKRRTWWSDDSSSWDEDDDDEEENIGGFGILEDAIGFSSIYKVLIAFGWMVPAVIVSMLIGTGTNGFVMALVLPLAQSALSLIFDAVMGRSTDRARPYSRKRSAFAGGARGNKKTRKERKQNSQSDRKSDGYQSWEAANNFSAKKRERRTQSFGGWDELDR